MKSVSVRSYSVPHFPAFGLNNSKYENFLRSVIKVANSPKQRLITVTLMSTIPGVLYDLREEKSPFSSFIETVYSGNLVFVDLT